MLTPYRRHLPTCKHRKDPDYIKCSCPVWCDGMLPNGERCRQSLKTRNWSEGVRRAERIERPNSERTDLIPCAQPGCPTRVDRGRCDAHRRTIAEAVEAFLNHSHGLESSTQRKYRNSVEHFRQFCESKSIALVSDVTVENLDAFRAGRGIGALTGVKELQVMRQFFGFCVNRKWTWENPAKQVATPRNIKPAEVVPYTAAEVSKIIAACDVIGRTPYERLRARAMVALLNNTALRVGDVAMLARDRVCDGQIMVRTLKTGTPVLLPIWPDTQAALEALPVPRGVAADESRHFFWNGITSRRAAVGIAERTLGTVFKRSGVPDAHAHRFRHTLATRLLGSGASFEDIADILGNSPSIVRKHYAKWSPARQNRIDSLMKATVFGTNLVHEKTESVIN